MSIWLISPSGDDDVGYRDHAPVASHQRPRHAVDHRRLRERGERGPAGDDFLGDGIGAVHSAGAAGPRAGRFLADLHNLLESPLRAAP
jgi:hypothetical protein